MTSEFHVFNFFFLFFIVFYFSDFSHVVMLSAVMSCFFQLSSFLPNPNLLLGLSCRVSNETPKQVSIVQQVKLLHSLSWSLAPVRCGFLSTFAVKLSSFCFPVRVKWCFWSSRSLRKGARVKMIQLVPLLWRAAFCSSYLLWEVMKNPDYQRFFLQQSSESVNNTGWVPVSRVNCMKSFVLDMVSRLKEGGKQDS